MRPAEEIKRLVTDAKVVIDADVRREALDELICELEKPETIGSVGARPNMWRIIMKSRTTKLAAAAVILIAILLALPFLPKDIGPVKLEAALREVENTTAYTYKMVMNMKMGQPMGPNTPPMDMDMEMTVLISKDMGMKAETVSVAANTGEKSTNILYVVPDERKMVTLMLDQKKYVEMEFSEEMLEKMRQQNQDPWEMIKQMMHCEYTELGRSVIDGVEVDGFLTTDPAILGGVGENVRMTLWVDVEKRLPFRSEMEFKMGDKMEVSGVVSDFAWNVPVTRDELTPVIPEDFEPMAGGFAMPDMSEEGFIEGLKLFAELKGAYPKKLSAMELAQEMMGFMTDRDVLEKLKNKMPELLDLDETRLDQLDKDEIMAKSMNMTKPLQSIGMFYMMLVAEKKEPVYYGETVGPDDVGAVLLRWKIGEGQYRVVFGDLSAMDVGEEQLAELEK